jgi:hypothetical protein
MGAEVATARRSDEGRVTLGGLFREHAHGAVAFLYTLSVFCVALALSSFSPRRTAVPQTYSVIFLFRGCVGWSDVPGNHHL